MNKKILILSLGDKRSGPTTWKNGLVDSLKKKGWIVNEIDTSSLTSLKSIFNVMENSVVHTFHTSPSAMVFLVLSKILNKRIIFTVHGNVFAEKKSKKGIKRIFWLPFYCIVFRIAHVITFPSNFLYNKILTLKPKIANKSKVVYNGIELFNKIQIANKPDISKILTITNFTHYNKAKGMEPLIEAVKKLRVKNHNLSLTIVGGGNYLEDFKSKYSFHFVNFEGFQPDVFQYFKSHGMFIYSSFLDNMPYVVLEAVISNIPTISVDVGAIKEILPNNSVVNATSKDIFKVLNHMLNDVTARDNLIYENNKFIQKFSWDNIVGEFINIYNNV